MSAAPATVLVLPGWQDSGPAHWQSQWQAAHPDWRRVQQRDWMSPRRAEWIATLDAVAQATQGPLVLLAHSLGCITVAHWAAARPAAATRVRHALLVAPPDVERADLPAALADFAPAPSAALPFPATLAASHDDPYCGFERARALADAWACALWDVGPAGHINVQAGYGPWPQGLARFQRMCVG
ncbi:alpha/beta hydrolase [Pseudoxanthomonas winnipegensis]|uniref:Alpha/beta hydrolase n=1 Tax=Pseudoxanthomonas winnipegensis TaxID=2480810 RepID=A0ABY1WE44_9GAMM|nr:alpha/beta hydrolase [Pseudoxanthomonas winnipegensis]TAA11969.1 alpha/beta hydrolase [Pseudoxanthomonas winnipegensis]TAA19666.1 alpha/beta hydrolase [Pseudoxanthomonas winnipegensis]TAH70917.1 alpha/beta hydrolase [Pseudoxanthomonas winnipegensis]